MSGVASLSGWMSDDLTGALDAYLRSRPSDWPTPDGDARAFFETAFALRDLPDGQGTLTGYHEPVLSASLVKTERFSVALHAKPSGWDGNGRWFSRAEIAAGNPLNGHELAWVESALDAFLAEVQGSVRLKLEDGRILRLGYAGKNGHPYVSIGKELIRRGEIAPTVISVQAIREWCVQHPAAVRELLDTNPSYVFFRLLDLPETDGPIGTAGVPLTPLRSIAVDPAHIPLGCPVWVESLGPLGMRRLLIAQDTGGAIKGPHRGDVFFGWDSGAADDAGRLNEPCRLIPLVPRGAA